MDPRCRIELFGGLRLLRQDRSLTRFRTQKAAALLAYLALNLRQTQAREQLLELFWPEMPLEAARGNLRTVLNLLRNVLEPTGVATGSVLLADRQTVRLNPVAVSTDVAEFDHLVALAAREAADTERIVLLEQAAALYTADLLPDRYDDWALREQHRCRNLYLEALQRLMAALERTGAPERALDVARRLAHEEPENEEACRLRMRLYAALGRSTAALETYHALEHYLRTELDAAPERETRELADALRGESPPPDTAPFSQPPPSGSESPQPAAATVPTPVAATPVPAASATASTPLLPLRLTRYFGRAAQQERLAALLVAPHSRLITLCGPGGIGKTRLALEVAARVTPHFAGRVWFVPLADLPDRKLIPAALVNALRLPSGAHIDPIDHIVSALGETPCLLVLDNFEHLLWETSLFAANERVDKNDLSPARNSAALIRLLLERISGLRCLVTSRQVLRLGGEQEFPLSPLALPASTDTAPERLQHNESVALFLDRAQAVHPGFVLTSQNSRAVSELCRRLDGIPLALEMTAAWARLLTPAKMLERLEHPTDLLIDRRRDLPARHRSLRAVFEGSYGSLEPDTRTFLARLSVFRGGWTLEAAEAVCLSDAAGEKEAHTSGGNVLEMLGELQERSLLEVREQEDTVRYRFLEPLRAFATEMLQKTGEAEQTAATHARFFLLMAEEAASHLYGPAPRSWLQRMDTDYDNLRCALDWCLTTEAAIVPGLRLAIALTPYWKIHNYLREGRDWLAKILARTQAVRRTPECARALLDAGLLALRQGDLEAGHALCEESFALYQELGDRRNMGSALSNLAGVALGRGDYAAAQARYEQALEIARAEENAQGLAIALTNLGAVAFLRNNLETARTLQEEALLHARRHSDRRTLSLIALNAGIVAIALDDFSEAQALLKESLQFYGEDEEITFLSSVLDQFGCLAGAQGDSERAIKLCGASAAMRDAVGLVVPFDERTALERSLALARTCVGETRFAALWVAGQSLSRNQAVAYALGQEHPS